MRTATCATCRERIPLTYVGGNDELWQHDATCHRGQPAPLLTQLPGVTFHEQALLAIKALARTGEPFTLGDAHPLVQATPINPQTEWPAALREAVRFGWVEWTGDYADSKVPTTKRSAVKVWRGCYAVRRLAA